MRAPATPAPFIERGTPPHAATQTHDRPRVTTRTREDAGAASFKAPIMRSPTSRETGCMWMSGTSEPTQTASTCGTSTRLGIRADHAAKESIRCEHDENETYASVLRAVASAHREQTADAPDRPDLSASVRAFWTPVGNSRLAARNMPAADVAGDRIAIAEALAPWREDPRGRAHWGGELQQHPALAGRVRLVEIAERRALFVDDDTGDDPSMFALTAHAATRVPVRIPYLQWLAHRLLTRGTTASSATVSGERQPDAPLCPRLLPQLGTFGDGVYLLGANLPGPAGPRPSTAVVFAALAHYVACVSAKGDTERCEYGSPFGTAIDVVLGGSKLALDPRGSTLADGLMGFVSTGAGRPKPPLDRNAIGTLGDDAVWITPLAEARTVRVVCAQDAVERVSRRLTDGGAQPGAAMVKSTTLAPAW